MKHLLIAAAFAATASHAFAGPSGDAARSHFEAIAAGDTARLARSYADGAQLNWVGGPLDGTYVGAESIREVWEKFTKAQGALRLAVADVQESANPKGATVSANVLFEGKQPIKVRYVLVYRDGRLVSETWQIDPALNVAARY